MCIQYKKRKPILLSSFVGQMFFQSQSARELFALAFPYHYKIYLQLPQFFESPLFYDTVVEIVFAFDIERSIALGTEGNWYLLTSQSYYLPL
jgi:hypothetical protein